MTFTQQIEAIISILIQVFVIFPYSALTIPRQRQLQQAEDSQNRPSSIEHPVGPHHTEESPSGMISDKVYKLCTNRESVSSLLAKDPSLTPGEAWKKLYGSQAVGENGKKSSGRSHRDHITEEDLQRARECGNWGPTQPSDLFLRIYHDALCTLDYSISSCMVSPSLMGSCGVIPLTIISTVPDIMRHMSNAIVRAEKEVILATNYWQNSVASKYITNAMKELSRRAGERGVKIVMKLQYDRGSPKQLMDNHYMVSEEEYLGKAVGLPRPEDIKNIDLQVMNYHKPMLGTFHCKYMLVDRNVAILQSNNIQDNDNVEMMIRMEGPIVDSIYDMALISWHKKLDPPLPTINTPAAQAELVSFNNPSHDGMFNAEGAIKGHSAIVRPDKMRHREAYAYKPRAINKPDSVSATPQEGAATMRAQHDAEDVPNDRENGNSINNGGSGNQHKEQKHLPGFSNAEKVAENFKAAVTSVDMEHADHHRVTEGGDASNNNLGNKSSDTEIREANGHGNTSKEREASSSKLEGSFSSRDSLPEHTSDDPHYDDDIAGEVARVQAAVSSKPGETQMKAVTRHLNHTKNVGFRGNAPECPSEEEMTPYTPHPSHDLFPIAMVCREPYGIPNHSSVYNPQNEAWLSALRNAKKNVFIQSPTLNAEPLVPAIIEACERGVDVYCYITLGYNDSVGPIIFNVK
ncbi:hypothetical protein F5884DRAFT_674832 [Xylogone sp. PMI_703]|nr:hypothetical protein F5884DRAFT_674832 [Xylogone sp. PMI_703]